MDAGRPRAVLAAVPIMRSLVLSLLLTLPAAAQFAPDITSVTPEIGPTSGGTTLTIRGNALYHGDCVLLICEPLRVFVGAREAEVLSKSPTEIVVRTAPHSAGRFDVTLFRDIDNTRGVARDAFTFGLIYERMLVPIVFPNDIAGANGSLWRTELSGFNSGGANFLFGDPLQTCQFPDGRCQWFVDRYRPFTPNVPTDGHVPGRLLYAGGPGDPERVSIHARVRDVSRETESHGVEVPAVTENRAYGPHEVIGLPRVPMGPLYRQKLRVYDLEGARGRSVTVRLIVFGVGELARTLTTTSEPSNDYPLYPGYAELDLDTIPELAGATRADVSIETPYEGKFWAFISVTNNATQQITTVTP